MKIVVFDSRLLTEAKKQIQCLTTKTVTFISDRCTTEQEFIKQTDDATVVLVSPWDKITASYLDACPTIRYVGLCGTSTANIDLDALKERNIAFSKVVSKNKEPVAEYFFMQLVRLARGVGDYQWKAEERELMQKSVGIIGLGHVGQAIAHLALAYKMNASYYSPHRKPDWEDQGLRYLDMADLVQSNEIVIACGPTNVQVLGKTEFEHIRPGSILVQASVGTVFDQSAFLKWITQEGNFAIFDKSSSEENYHSYKNLPRVIYSNSIAGDTYESNERRGQRIIENLKAYLHAHEEETR